MTLIDRPRYLPPEAYATAIERMCRRVCDQPGVRCVYQIGHVSTPGMSDVDMVVLFDEGASFVEQPRTGLSADESYLFVHDLFGITRPHFAEALGCTFFHNYQLLSGTAPPEAPHSLPVSAVTLLKQQTALEYLLKMYVSLSVEISYRIVKLRSLFLLSKALLYDCEFLGIKEGPFYQAVQAIVARRQKWFTGPPPTSGELKTEIKTLHARLGETLSALLRAHRFYLPPRPQHRLAPHLRLTDGPELEVRHRGVRLPAFMGKLGRRYFNLQHRLNRFEFVAPYSTVSIPGPIQQLFDLREQMADTNRKSFPHFMSLSSSLTLV